MQDSYRINYKEEGLTKAYQLPISLLTMLQLGPVLGAASDQQTLAV
jgi:hypothetical protein